MTSTSSHGPGSLDDSLDAALAAPSSALGAPSARDLAIDLSRVSKVYKRWPWNPGVAALRNVSMQIRRGEVFGLLGPNGAGKSTLVKILMTVVKPTECRGTMLGRSVGSKRALLRVGYLPEHHRFPDYLTARQVLHYFAGLSGVDGRTRKARASTLLDMVGLGGWSDKRVREFSKGMRQRLGIAQALMHDPELVLLDEPTDGVDPVGRRDIRELLLAERRRGRTVLLNSHLLSELEMVCDRVAIMVQGRVTQQGTLQELTEYGQRYEIEIALPAKGGGAVVGDALRPLALLASANDAPVRAGAAATEITAGRLNSGATIEIEGAVIRIGTADPVIAQPVLDALRARGVIVRSFRSVRPTLEDLFMRAVTDGATGKVLPPGAQVTRNAVDAEGGGR